MKSILGLLAFNMLLFIASCGKQKQQEAPAADSTAVVNIVTKKIIHAKIYLKPEKVADFIKEAKAMVDSSNMEAGCESYQLYQDPYDNAKFIFVEVWKDQQAIDAHFNMSYFKAWGPKTKDWLAQPTELKIYDIAVEK